MPFSLFRRDDTEALEKEYLNMKGPIPEEKEPEDGCLSYFVLIMLGIVYFLIK